MTSAQWHWGEIRSVSDFTESDYHFHRCLRFEIYLLFLVLKWKISHSSLCIKKKKKPLGGLCSIKTADLCCGGQLENLSFAIRVPSLKGEGAVVPRSDMQTNPHTSLQPLPSQTHRQGTQWWWKPLCGGVLPVFLSVGFHGALKKKKAFYWKCGVGGGGNFVMFLGKVQKQICL